MRQAGTQLRGFSLLELTLALVITAMLALSMYMSMSVCIRARRSANGAVQPVRAGTVAMELICQDLESVLPPTGILAGSFLGTRQPGTTGDADYLVFHSLGRDGDLLGGPMSEGIRRIELGLRTDVKPQVLVRRVTRNLLARAEVEPEEEILCRGVRSLSLRYFDGMTWLEDWDSTMYEDVLPAAVSIHLELDDPQAMVALPEQPVSRMTRVIPLACAKLSSLAASSTSGGVSGGTSGGTGGTP